MSARRTLTPTTLGLIVAACTLGSTANAAATHATAPQSAPRWEQALMARGRALERRDGLGSYTPIGRGIVPPGRHPTWLRALDLRSIALDRVHHLGSFTRAIDLRRLIGDAQ
jgi:hypothetical protein